MSEERLESVWLMMRLLADPANARAIGWFMSLPATERALVSSMTQQEFARIFARSTDLVDCMNDDINKPGIA